MIFMVFHFILIRSLHSFSSSSMELRQDLAHRDPAIEGPSVPLRDVGGTLHGDHAVTVEAQELQSFLQPKSQVNKRNKPDDIVYILYILHH